MRDRRAFVFMLLIATLIAWLVVFAAVVSSTQKEGCINYYAASEIVGQHESVSFQDGRTVYFLHLQRERHLSYAEVPEEVYQAVCKGE